MKQNLIELKRETENSIIMIGNFNTPLSIMYKTTRQKLDKEIKNLNNIINKLEITNFYKILHMTAKYIFFSRAHRTPSDTDHILGHKTPSISLKGLELCKICSSVTVE